MMQKLISLVLSSVVQKYYSVQILLGFSHGTIVYNSCLIWYQISSRIDQLLQGRAVVVWSQDLGMFWSQDLELVELGWMVCTYLRCEERISTAINWKSIFNKYEVWNTNITICTKQNSLP